ncbi:HDR103Wp [Eremothecium sinecaudum]|uniref:Sugar phosphate phosphatase n=1 Tax=Eremothecium sinecaudum TaxID=45286 RepID=A0A0X8HSU8_9SACH|nr:HDR103Wp [Eremothecium sinecaudum]AMD20845.1 HDR103Wp [Eremothecium sinecaudum]
MYERYTTDLVGTFGEYTARVRWPTIIQNSIDAVTDETRPNKEAILEGFKGLLDEVDAGTPLRKFTDKEIKAGSLSSKFNEFVENQSWKRAEWLSCEIYLYARLYAIVRLQSGWEDFDVFDVVKRKTFKQSEHGVVELALWQQKLGGKEKIGKLSKEELHLLFIEYLEVSLWGNATDLSLLTDLTLDDIRAIQGEAARAAARKRIIVDHSERAWETLTSSEGKKRVDFVLDNAGFELYADLAFAIFLLDADLADKVVMHAKTTPYMVSDTMVKDFYQLIDDLKSNEFFACDGSDGHDPVAARSSLNYIASRVTAAVVNGKLKVRDHSYWTEPEDFWSIVPGHEVHSDLSNSALVIFKGDLNYRKLTGDRIWPPETPWTEAIGPLATNGLKILSLRTCKADVIAGLEPGVDEALSAEWVKKGNEHGSWWKSSGNWAVICFSDGKGK